MSITARITTVQQNQQFVNECFNYFCDDNEVDHQSFNPLKQIWIVHKGHRDIGFFELEETMSTVKAKFWMHPKSCPKGLLVVQKCAAMVCYEILRREPEYEKMVLEVKDLFSIRLLRKTCPGLTDHIIDKNFIICYCNKNNIEGGNNPQVNDKYEVEIEE
jgi:hypothetical protein